MGKNQGWKDTQRGKHGTGDGAPNGEAADGMVDASWHTPEWHAARIASLQVERLPWDEWKKRQKQEEAKQALAAGEEERLMLEYRAQLAADREKRLAKGTNHADLNEKLASKKRKRKDKKEKKDKDKKKKKDKDKGSKRKKDKKDKKDKKEKESKKRRRRDSSGSDSGSGSSSSLDTDSDAEDGPIRLSDYLKA